MLLQGYWCRERIWYCNTNDTGASSGSDIQDKRNGQKKLLTNTYKCYKASKFLSKNDLATFSIWHEKNSFPKNS